MPRLSVIVVMAMGGIARVGAMKTCNDAHPMVLQENAAQDLLVTKILTNVSSSLKVRTEAISQEHWQVLRCEGRQIPNKSSCTDISLSVLEQCAQVYVNTGKFFQHCVRDSKAKMYHIRGFTCIDKAKGWCVIEQGTLPPLNEIPQELQIKIAELFIADVVKVITEEMHANHIQIFSFEQRTWLADGLHQLRDLEGVIPGKEGVAEWMAEQAKTGVLSKNFSLASSSGGWQLGRFFNKSRTNREYMTKGSLSKIYTDTLECPASSASAESASSRGAVAGAAPQQMTVAVKVQTVHSPEKYLKVALEHQIMRKFSGGAFISFLDAQAEGFRLDEKHELGDEGSEKGFKLAGEASGNYSFMMELATGTLNDVSDNRTKLVDKVRYYSEAMVGLATMHKLGFIHRDVKPANILLVEGLDKKHAVVTDFGITCEEKSVSEMPRSATFKGTMWYLPPEVIEFYSPWPQYRTSLDIWGMALVLYKLIFGQLPIKVQSQALTDIQGFAKKNCLNVTNLAHNIQQIEQETLVAAEGVANLICDSMSEIPAHRILAQEALIRAQAIVTLLGGPTDIEHDLNQRKPKIPECA